MDLSTDQERYLHTVLDKGIESLTDDDLTAVAEPRYVPSSMQETPTLPGLPTSVIQSSSSTSRLLYGESPVGVSKTPVNLSFAESQSLLSEMQSLQEKVTSMESLLRIHSSSPRRVQTDLRAPRDPQRRSSSSSRRSPSPTAERLFHEIEKSEKELERYGKSTLKSPERRSNSTNSTEIGRLKAELAEERRKYALVMRENEILRSKLTQKEDLQVRLAALQEDYNALSVSFDKSEAIRRKQKDLIQQLKREAESDESEAGKLYAKTKKPSSAKKPGKSNRSKLIYAD